MIGVNMPSDSTPLSPRPGQGQPATPPKDEVGAAAWKKEFEEFGPARVAQVNASAQAWLGIMTTLLGLFSAVVVLNQGSAIGELPIGRVGRGILFTLAVIVYGFAFIAVVYGAAAVSGGLGFGLERPSPPKSLTKWSKALGLSQPAWHLWQFWNPEPLSPLPPNYTWERFRQHRLERAETLRTHLHRSRLLGVAAAILAGVLALAVLWIGAFVHPSPAPTSVVVVHRGQVTCGSIGVGADGQTRVGGRVISRATQVVVVAHC
jgi:hypothetical protein